MANHELSKQEVIDKAQAYCARSEHCAADVRRKLYEWGVSAEMFDETEGIEPLWREIEQNLYDNGYLNDARYCAAYVHDKVAYQRWGRMKIQAGLVALQLPSDAIRMAIEDIDEETYTDNLRTLMEQRKGDSEEKRLRFLLQRGFTYEEIKKCK